MIYLNKMTYLEHSRELDILLADCLELNHQRYTQYASIAPRISQTLAYLGYSFPKDKVHDTLMAYYLFVAIVDDLMDAGQPDIGWRVLDYFRDNDPLADYSCKQLRQACEILRYKIHRDYYQTFLEKLDRLHRKVLEEKAATDSPCYFDLRVLTGGLTAEISFDLIGDVLDHKKPPKNNLIVEIGEVGSLIDSIVDAPADFRNKLMSVSPGFRFYQSLLMRTGKMITGILWRNPQLFGLCLESTADVWLDRFRRPDGRKR